jgi:hypothetical protein
VKPGQKEKWKKALARLRSVLDGRDRVAKTAAMLEGILQRQECQDHRKACYKYG